MAKLKRGALSIFGHRLEALDDIALALEAAGKQMDEDGARMAGNPDGCVNDAVSLVPSPSYQWSETAAIHSRTSFRRPAHRPTLLSVVFQLIWRSRYASGVLPALGLRRLRGSASGQCEGDLTKQM